MLRICAVRMNPIDKSYLLSAISTLFLEHGRAQTAQQLLMKSFELILESPIGSIDALCETVPSKIDAVKYHMAELLSLNIIKLIKIKNYEHKFEDVAALRMLNKKISTQLLDRLTNMTGATLEDKLAQLSLLWSSLVPDPSLHDDEEARRVIRKDQEQITTTGKQLVDCLEQKAIAAPKEKHYFEKYRNFCSTLASILRICSKYSEADDLLRRVDETRKRIGSN